MWSFLFVLKLDFKPINDKQITLQMEEVDYEDLWKEGDIYVHLHRWDGLSLPIDEAMAPGCPLSLLTSTPIMNSYLKSSFFALKRRLDGTSRTACVRWTFHNIPSHRRPYDRQSGCNGRRGNCAAVGHRQPYRGGAIVDVRSRNLLRFSMSCARVNKSESNRHLFDRLQRQISSTATFSATHASRVVEQMAQELLI